MLAPVFRCYVHMYIPIDEDVCFINMTLLLYVYLMHLSYLIKRMYAYIPIRAVDSCMYCIAIMLNSANFGKIYVLHAQVKGVLT